MAEREQAARAEQPRDLGHRHVRIGERHRAVVAEDDVEASRPSSGASLGARVHERELDARLGQRACARARAAARELSSPTGRAPRPREQDRPLGGAAAELEHVLAGDVAEHPELGLRDLPHAPARLRLPDELAVALLVLVGGCVPELAVAASRRQTSSSPNQSAISRAADSGESEPCTRLSGIASARSPRIVPGAASAGFGRAHRRPHDRDRRLALEHERERRRRGDELDELAEERLLRVLGVVLARRARGRPRRAARRGARARARSKRARISPASARCTASGLISTSVRSTAIGRGVYCELGRCRSRRGGCSALRVAKLDRRRLSTGVSQYGQTCQSASSGALAVRARLLQLRRADRADEERRLDLGAADRAVQVAPGEPLLHRLDLELALAHVLEVLGRPEEHVDQRADERRDERRARSPSPTSHGSSIRRRASLKTQNAIASQKTTTKKIARLRMTNQVPE